MKKDNVVDKYTVIAPLGDSIESLFLGLREFHTKKVLIVAHNTMKHDAAALEADLEKMRVESQTVFFKGVSDTERWENIFKAISGLVTGFDKNELIVNAGIGDALTQCAAACAAFAGGIKAFTITNDKIVMLPFMRFSYYKVIPDRKMEILKTLNYSPFSSFEELSKKTQMSLPLISYHIHGNLKSEGLVNMGLIDTKVDKNRIAIELSTLGRLMVGGYLSNAAET